MRAQYIEYVANGGAGLRPAAAAAASLLAPVKIPAATT
jgi:hypothetical protein